MQHDKSDFQQLNSIQAMDKIEEDQDTYGWYDYLWDVIRVLCHREEHNKIEVLCKFKDPNKSTQWVNMFALALQDPVPLIAYARRMHLVDKNTFRMLVNYCTEDAPSDLFRAYDAKVRPGGQKFKFEIQVPLGMKQALALDRKNENSK